MKFIYTTFALAVFIILSLEESGGRGRSRTCDRLVRSQVLYPAELRALMNYFLYLSLKIANFRSTQPLFFTRKENGGEGGIRTLDPATNQILP
jgi:hypothetical protein